MKHYELAPLVWHETTLVFDWDVETGVVTGPDAAYILQVVNGGFVPAHPIPWTWELSAEPTKSLTDMAAILGWSHRLPDDLQAHYPEPAEEIEDASDLDDVPTVEPVH